MKPRSAPGAASSSRRSRLYPSASIVTARWMWRRCQQRQSLAASLGLPPRDAAGCAVRDGSAGNGVFLPSRLRCRATGGNSGRSAPRRCAPHYSNGRRGKPRRRAGETVGMREEEHSSGVVSVSDIVQCGKGAGVETPPGYGRFQACPGASVPRVGAAPLGCCPRLGVPNVLRTPRRH